MRKLHLLLILSIALFYFSCNQQNSTDESDDTDTMLEEMPDEEAEEMQAQEIQLVPLTDSPTFPGASLSMTAPNGQSDNPVHFDFTVEGYELGVQTSDAEAKTLANSAKGQHIHLILNNGPYSAHYEPSFDKELEEGHYVVLAFLSRSYHESVKAPDAFQVDQFNVGSGGESNFDPKAPHMFYSRPKGTYVGKDAERVLLDFFMYNANLSEEGYTVKATINGTEFMLTEWVPYVIEGAPMGDLTVRLELLDAEGNTVDSPFNPVERVVKLKTEEDPS